MWNRYNYPTVNDADEGGDILILRNNGHKAVYNWEDFCDEKLLARDIGWMPLPPSDNVEGDPGPPITITISSGGRSFTIEKVVSHIEVYDSHDPMGQPIISEEVDGLDGVLRMVESILVDGFIEAPDDDCGCEPVAVNDVEFNVDVELQGFIDTLRGRKTEEESSGCCKNGKFKLDRYSYVDWTAGPGKDHEPDDDCGCEGVLVNDTVLQGFIDAIRGSVPEPKPKPWQKNRGK